MLKTTTPSGYLSSKHSYKENRMTMKNGFLVSCLIMFKSTISIGMLNNQMYFFGSGWLLSVIITIIVTFLISYGMILICQVARDIEQKNKNVKIDTFEAVALYVSNNERTRKIWYIGKTNNQSVQGVRVHLQSSGGVYCEHQFEQVSLDSFQG
jgi:hypothetical protein